MKTKGAGLPAPFRQYLQIGRREEFWIPAEMCWCCSPKERRRCSVPERPRPSAVSTDEMEVQRFWMRSSAAEHRPHKAARTGSSPVASTSFRCVAQSGQSTAFGTQGPEVQILVHRPVNRRVEESGRPRESHKLEIAGSNPASATSHAWVAQSVGRRFEEPCRGGSIPSPCTRYLSSSTQGMQLDGRALGF